MNHAFNIQRIEKHVAKEFLKSTLEDMFKLIADKLDEQAKKIEEKDAIIKRLAQVEEK